jgi:predicted TIM-barrel fold metal-dependent hydrolase
LIYKVRPLAVYKLPTIAIAVPLSAISDNA